MNIDLPSILSASLAEAEQELKRQQKRYADLLDKHMKLSAAVMRETVAPTSPPAYEYKDVIGCSAAQKTELTAEGWELYTESHHMLNGGLNPTDDLLVVACFRRPVVTEPDPTGDDTQTRTEDKTPIPRLEDDTAKALVFGSRVQVRTDEGGTERKRENGVNWKREPGQTHWRVDSEAQRMDVIMRTMISDALTTPGVGND